MYKTLKFIVFQYTNIYRCIKIRRNYVFYTRRFLNLHVLKHGDSRNMSSLNLQIILCFNTWRFKNLRV